MGKDGAEQRIQSRAERLQARADALQAQDVEARLAAMQAEIKVDAELARMKLAQEAAPLSPEEQ
jgi:hypothetical protein